MAEGFYVTNTGLKEITLAVNKGEKVNINSVAVGTGGDYEGERDYTISELKNQVYYKDFDMYDHYDIDEQYENTILIEFTIPDDAGVIEGINEVGFFDTEGHLIVYGVLQSITKRVGTAGNLYRVTIVAYMPFTNEDLEFVNLVIGTDALRELERRTNVLEDEMDTAQQDILDLNSELDRYVLKENGRGLSTNDFDNVQKNQIQTNKEDISNIKKDLQGRPDINTTNALDKRVTTNEKNIKALQTDMATKASQSSLDSLKSTVTTLTSTVNGKASNSSVTELENKLNSLTSTVNSKPNTSNITDLENKIKSLTTTVNGKASSSSVTTLENELSSLTTTVNGKASSSSVTSLEARVRALENTLSGLEATLEELI